jgi:hypothetical protein
MNVEFNGLERKTHPYLKLETRHGFTHLGIFLHRKHTLALRTPPHGRTQGVAPELFTCMGRWDGRSGPQVQPYNSAVSRMRC